jgi:hypothetical protein
MKTFILFVLILSTTSTWAGRCLISGKVLDGSSCHRLSTRISVDTKEGCEAFAKSTNNNRFFNLLSERQKLISTKYSYKTRGHKRIKNEIEFRDAQTCD